MKYICIWYIHTYVYVYEIYIYILEHLKVAESTKNIFLYTWSKIE